MKAVRLHELQGPDELVYEDVPEPEPGPGETVVRLRAAALNRRDLFATQGQYPGVTPDILPRIPGSDGSGEVVARGDGAEGPDEATEVVINPALYWGDDPRVPGKEYRILGIPDDGTFAQFIKLPADHVFPKPSHLSHEEAAALPLAALTAYRALVTRGGVAEDETVVVPGVGGGVATFLVQIASALGARVFVTSGSDEKIEESKELGAQGAQEHDRGRGPLGRPRRRREFQRPRLARQVGRSDRRLRGDGRPDAEGDDDPYSAQAPRRARHGDGHPRGVRRDARPLRRARPAPDDQRDLRARRDLLGPPPHARRQGDGQDSPRHTCVVHQT